MCARFAFFSGKIIKDEFGVPVVPDLQPRFNIPPTSVIPAVIQSEQGRELRLFQWGLVPSWAKDPAIGARMINARAETLAEKPTFRAAFKRRRCLIPADGFYEWIGDKGRKQPYYITMRTNRTFAFAGLWEYWEGVDGALETCTIITTEANETVAKVHDRMPVIVARGDYATWLDTRIETPPQLRPILTPYPPEEMKAHPVSKAMGNPTFDGPDCILPVDLPSLFS
ncbi:MAG: SOS response-associated peptidase [Armatimonadetes bacterium]|nr:SOS response-associated peptidase [Armatimonadota bacterium]